MNKKLLLNNILTVIFFLLYIAVSRAESFNIDSPNSITDSIQLKSQSPANQDNYPSTSNNSNNTEKSNLPVILDDPNDFDKVENPNAHTDNNYQAPSHNYNNDNYNNNDSYSNDNANEVYKPNLPMVLDDPNDFDKVSSPNPNKQTESHNTDSHPTPIINQSNESSVPLDDPNLIDQIQNNTDDNINYAKPQDPTRNQIIDSNHTNRNHTTNSNTNNSKDIITHNRNNITRKPHNRRINSHIHATPRDSTIHNSTSHQSTKKHVTHKKKAITHKKHITHKKKAITHKKHITHKKKAITHKKPITHKKKDITHKKHITHKKKAITHKKSISHKKKDITHKKHITHKKNAITHKKPITHKKKAITHKKPISHKHLMPHKITAHKKHITKRRVILANKKHLAQKHLAKKHLAKKHLAKKHLAKKVIPHKEIKHLTHAQILAKTKKDNRRLQKWFLTIKKEALKQGISSKMFNYLAKQARIREGVVASDRQQPEFNLRLSEYLRNMLESSRIRKGKLMLKKYHKFLHELEQKYGVQPEYLVAFWGAESFYGKNMGHVKLLNSLSTLAFNNHRKEFFKAQLFIFMKMVQERRLDENTLGSWAGALGNLQFMPSTLKLYGADGDGDGYIDVINSPKDALESAAHYLKRIGWQASKRWGRIIKIPRNFKGYKYVGETKRRPAKIWNRLGLKTYDGKRFILPSDMDARIDMPEGRKGLAFIYYNNFHIIYRWNVSRAYSISIGLIANSLKNEKMPNFSYYLKRIKQPKRADILRVQRHLINLGYLEKGSDDSVVGSTTAQAIKLIQTKTHLIPDGYLDQNTIMRILRYKTKYHTHTTPKKHPTSHRHHK